MSSAGIPTSIWTISSFVGGGTSSRFKVASSVSVDLNPCSLAEKIGNVFALLYLR